MRQRRDGRRCSLSREQHGHARSQPPTPTPRLTILHLNVGCRSWSLNAGPFRVEQTLRLREGQSLRVINYDRFTRQLIQVSGGALAIGGGPSLLRRAPGGVTIPLPPEPGAPAADAADGVMGHWGASVTATFEEPGT